MSRSVLITPGVEAFKKPEPLTHSELGFEWEIHRIVKQNIYGPMFDYIISEVHDDKL